MATASYSNTPNEPTVNNIESAPETLKSEAGQHDQSKHTADLVNQVAEKAIACSQMSEASIAKWQRWSGKPYNPEDMHFDEHTEKNKERVDSVVNTLKSIDLNIFNSNEETAWVDLGMDRVYEQLSSIHGRMKDRERFNPLEYGKLMVEMPKPGLVIVDTATKVAAMMEDLVKGLYDPGDEEAILAVDLEGWELGREGTITIVSLYVPTVEKAYLVDVHVLGREAFTIPTMATTGGISLKTVLEDTKAKKLLFDCRGDNDALFGLYKIQLDGVVDVQLMDLATRHKMRDRKTVSSLSRVAPERLKLAKVDKEAWRAAKDWGESEWRFGQKEAKRMYEVSGGNWCSAISSVTPQEDLSEKVTIERKDSFQAEEKEPNSAYSKEYTEERPLSDIAMKYCAGDVVLLPLLYKHFAEHRFWNEAWAKRVDVATSERLEMSRAGGFAREGAEMRAPPKGWIDVEQAARD